MIDPQPIGTFVIITNDQKQVLLGKRINSYGAGMYGFPGGRIDVDEPIVSAITREVSEETGLTNLDYSYVGVIRENQGDYDFIHFVFSAKLKNTQPVLGEPNKCESWEWFDLDQELADVLPGHMAGIDLLKSGKTFAELVN